MILFIKLFFVRKSFIGWVVMELKRKGGRGSGKTILETVVKVTKFNDDFFSFYWLIFMGISKERHIF
jgi:hypothetical protein